MKIGILTFHRALNYGAVLQMYALQTVLIRENHHVEFLDYRNTYLERKYKSINFRVFFERKNIFKSLKMFINKLLTCSLTDLKRTNFKLFIDNYIKISNIQFTSSEEIPKKYDVYVVGSDQVWNTVLTGGFDDVYFFTGLKNKIKISYAASLEGYNHQFIKNNKEKYKKLLSNFNHISVREKEVNNLLQPIVNKAITTVLDPTLLLNVNDYDSITLEPKEKDYLIIYHLVWHQELIDTAKKIAEARKLEIIEIHAGVKPFKKTNRHKQTLSPAEFLGYFKNASFVVTTSFHGTCFSIIYKKDFYVLNKSASARQKNILKELNIEDRIIFSNTEAKADLVVDYKLVYPKLEKLRTLSNDYLRNSINNVI
jgi:hypothetical protein